MVVNSVERGKAMKRDVDDKQEGMKIDADAVFHVVLLAAMVLFTLCLGSYAFAVGAIPVY